MKNVTFKLQWLLFEQIFGAKYSNTWSQCKQMTQIALSTNYRFIEYKFTRKESIAHIWETKIILPIL